MQKHCYVILVTIFSLLISSCLEPNGTPQIENNIAYPGKLVALDDSRFLLLNTDAASKFQTGSIHRYKTSKTEDPVLEHVFQVPSHGSDMALTDDNKLLALGFDGSKENTQLFFYDFSNPNNPQLLNSLILDFAAGGGKQSIKQLSFFKLNTNNPALQKDYYLYGVILNSPLDTGKGDRIPTRSFVAKVSKDFSSSQILFVLSYGVGDEQKSQALTPKSDSLKPSFDNETQYMIGSSAPLFDPTHNLFFAFPTGSMNGYNNTNINEYPQLPFDLTTFGNRENSALQYFSGKKGANLNCSSDKECIQPDLRAVSVFIVDMVDYLTNHPSNVNASLYFSPLAWNLNGVPYNHNTKGGPLILGGSNSTEIKSFTFQYNFWSSFLQPDGSILLAKKGENGKDDKDGNGNEVFRVTGLDALQEHIQYTKLVAPLKTEDAYDFAKIASRQVFDSYQLLHDESVAELTKGLEKKDHLLIPYIFARTTEEVSFKAATAVHGFDTVCSNSNDSNNTCYSYWIRSSYLGFNGQGRDTSWLTVALPQTEYHPGDNPDFPDAIRDPSKFTTYDMPQLQGAFICVTLARTDIYCVNYLSGDFTKLNVTSKGFSDAPFKNLQK